MLEYFYSDHRALIDFRRGPLGPCFDAFAAHLKKQGYSHDHARHILGVSCQFNDFLIRRGITRAVRFTPELADAFGKEYLANFRTTCKYSADHFLTGALRHLLNHLVGM